MTLHEYFLSWQAPTTPISTVQHHSPTNNIQPLSLSLSLVLTIIWPLSLSLCFIVLAADHPPSWCFIFLWCGRNSGKMPFCQCLYGVVITVVTWYFWLCGTFNKQTSNTICPIFFLFVISKMQTLALGSLLNNFMCHFFILFLSTISSAAADILNTTTLAWVIMNRTQWLLFLFPLYLVICTQQYGKLRSLSHAFLSLLMPWTGPICSLLISPFCSLCL